jgi:Leucine-rich repeat (LRR) protein
MSRLRESGGIADVREVELDPDGNLDGDTEASKRVALVPLGEDRATLYGKGLDLLVPDNVQLSSRLEILHCGDNRLAQWDKLQWLGQLRPAATLRTLSLQENRLTGIVPDWIGASLLLLFAF